MKFAAITLALPLILAACNDDRVTGHDTLFQQVSAARIGNGADYWIEMKNISGEWERTGLIFGYTDDYGECMNAIAGLKSVNYAREYRCTQAN